MRNCSQFHISRVSTPRSEKTITMFMAESYVGHKICRPGDLVINTMWAWMGAFGVAPPSRARESRLRSIPTSL